MSQISCFESCSKLQSGINDNKWPLPKLCALMLYIELKHYLFNIIIIVNCWGSQPRWTCWSHWVKLLLLFKLLLLQLLQLLLLFTMLPAVKIVAVPQLPLSLLLTMLVMLSSARFIMFPRSVLLRRLLKLLVRRLLQLWKLSERWLFQEKHKILLNSFLKGRGQLERNECENSHTLSLFCALHLRKNVQLKNFLSAQNFYKTLNQK